MVEQFNRSLDEEIAGERDRAEKREQRRRDRRTKHIEVVLEGDGVYMIGIFQTLNGEKLYRAVPVAEFAEWLAAREDRLANV